MRRGQGRGACAHDLVGVAARSMPQGAAPGAEGIRRSAPRASRHGLAGVDAARGNRRPGSYTPGMTASANDAWVQNFNNGNQNYNNKNNDWRVRAVRK